MRHAKVAAIGAVTFVALHLLLVAAWQRWFNGGNSLAPWFMNSTPTVVLTLVVFAAVGAVVGDGAGANVASAALVATGGAVPMLLVLFTRRGGPGTLFPIAIFVGWLLLFVGATLGSGLAWLVRHRFDS